MAECNHEWQLTETGYTRTWHTEVDPETKTITATLSESGAGDAHLACIWCGAEQSIEGWEVDWQ